MKPRVFVSRPLAEPGIRKLAQFCDVVVWDRAEPPSPEELRAAVAPCQGLLVVTPSRVDEALLDAAPKLKVISANGVGVDNIDLDACRRRGIPVGNTPEVLTDATADVAWALLMAAARRVPEADVLVRSGQWKPFSSVRSITGAST